MVQAAEPLADRSHHQQTSDLWSPGPPVPGLGKPNHGRASCAEANEHTTCGEPERIIGRPWKSMGALTTLISNVFWAVRINSGPWSGEVRFSAFNSVCCVNLLMLHYCQTSSPGVRPRE